MSVKTSLINTKRREFANGGVLFLPKWINNCLFLSESITAYFIDSYLVLFGFKSLHSILMIMHATTKKGIKSEDVGTGQ